jgi:hypothetical protein
MTDTTASASLRWGKALLNGLLAWILGFVIYMIPSLVVAFKMGFELGPQGVESSAISSQISQAISQMYQENIWLSIGYAAVIALLVFWRARVVARGTGTQRVAHGLLVAAIPAVFSLVSAAVTQPELSSFVNAAIFCLAGYIGGRTAKETLS